MSDMLFLELDMNNLIHAYHQIINVPIYHIFMGLVFFDILTGIVKGFTNKEANSTKGLLGVVKHLLVLILVLTVTPYLVMLGVSPMAFSFIGFFIAQYGISAVENWVQIGLPMHPKVSQYFEKINRETSEIDMNNVKIKIDTPKKENDI